MIRMHAGPRRTDRRTDGRTSTASSVKGVYRSPVLQPKYLRTLLLTWYFTPTWRHDRLLLLLLNDNASMATSGRQQMIMESIAHCYCSDVPCSDGQIPNQISMPVDSWHVKLSVPTICAIRSFGINRNIVDEQELKDVLQSSWDEIHQDSFDNALLCFVKKMRVWIKDGDGQCI